MNTHNDIIAARESALARCRRDGGPLHVVKATTKDGKPFTSETLPPHDAKFLALDLKHNFFTDITVETVN